MSLPTLPPEILLHIFQHISHEDIPTIARLNKFINSLLQNILPRHQIQVKRYGTLLLEGSPAPENLEVLKEIIQEPCLASYVRRLELSHGFWHSWEEDPEDSTHAEMQSLCHQFIAVEELLLHARVEDTQPSATPAAGRHQYLRTHIDEFERIDTSNIDVEEACEEPAQIGIAMLPFFTNLKYINFKHIGLDDEWSHGFNMTQRILKAHLVRRATYVPTKDASTLQPHMFMSIRHITIKSEWDEGHNIGIRDLFLLLGLPCLQSLDVERVEDYSLYNEHEIDSLESYPTQEWRESQSNTKAPLRQLTLKHSNITAKGPRVSVQSDTSPHTSNIPPLAPTDPGNCTHVLEPILSTKDNDETPPTIFSGKS